MGTKRPFDEELQDFIKHPKHGDYSSKPDLFEENLLTPEKSQNIGVAGKGDDPESKNFFSVPDMVCKGFETGAPLPLVTDDDGAPGSVFCSDLFPEFFEFNVPRRHLVRFDEMGSSFLYCFPRKEVPIGPDHQADVPEFDPETARNHRVNNDKFVGVCIVPMSDSGCLTEESQTGCDCVDGGSVRCVRQHVGEACAKLKWSFGDRKFVDLGFSDMGEEVAVGWTEEEERVFHDVVYRNPASLGQKFWERLSVAFPARTKKELVSYYFNVFVLRRRAAQNRSSFLAADSDDDEWWGNDGGGGFVVGGSSEDESSEDGGDPAAAGERDAFGGVKDDSCVSFEDQRLRADPCKPVDESSPIAIGGLQLCSAANGERQLCAGEWSMPPRDAKDD